MPGKRSNDIFKTKIPSQPLNISGDSQKGFDQSWTWLALILLLGGIIVMVTNYVWPSHFSVVRGITVFVSVVGTFAQLYRTRKRR